MFKKINYFFLIFPFTLITLQLLSSNTLAVLPRNPDKEIECELLIVGGGLAGTAAAYEGLLAGRTVCLTEITDWIGGQISSQGTSALDERPTQRSQLFYSRGYLELRERIKKFYGKLNPGECWVSKSCFMPKEGHKILMDMLKDAERKGKGHFIWFPSTVVKDLSISKHSNKSTGKQITNVIAIQHHSIEDRFSLNSYPLSQIIQDIYSYKNSTRLSKKIIRFIPKLQNNSIPANWYIIEATETGEIIALSDVPYRLGVDPVSYLEPSSSSKDGNPFCTQGFTYTFAMETISESIVHKIPKFYSQYSPYYSYELERLADFDLIYTYRRIWSPSKGKTRTFNRIKFSIPTAGDISMQNWTWGNDYRPGNSKDNLIYTRTQLKSMNQLNPGKWMGGLRRETLRKGEEHSKGYFYWLVSGTMDSQLKKGVKRINKNTTYLKGLRSPMGTYHGLSKYPYIRESRRILGRKSFTHKNGFSINEIDISRQNYRSKYYQETLSFNIYQQLNKVLAKYNKSSILNEKKVMESSSSSQRSTIYFDSIGIGHYPIDFHPCMNEEIPEKAGNSERNNERQGQGKTFPFQIPLRAILPQEIDNLIIAGKGIATSHIAAAAYRVHSFEWSSGAAAGTIADFAINEKILPYQLITSPSFQSLKLQKLQRKLTDNKNPIKFPHTSIFNNNWNHWQ